MTGVAEQSRTRPFSELTRQVFGQRLSMAEVWNLLDGFESEGAAAPVAPAFWVGSIGYERYKDNADFAQLLVEARVERLVDVRELPISRRRGYAKTALRETLEAAGVEYVHMKALGNPKPIRDMYKAGRPHEGRRRYEAFLSAERRYAVDDLASLLGSKRTALMCVEHDASVCHRAVIIDALRSALDRELVVGQLG